MEMKQEIDSPPLGVVRTAERLTVVMLMDAVECHRRRHCHHLP